MVVFVFTAMGWIPFGLLGCIVQLYLAGPNYKLPWYLLVVLLLLSAGPGFLFGLWFANKQLNKLYWELTEAELICGSSRKQVFQLASVEKVIVGLPSGAVGRLLKGDKPGSWNACALNALEGVDRSGSWRSLRQVYTPMRENSLLICFNNGSCLPLCLYALPNGAAIMEELKERFKDRLLKDYNYSPMEVRRVRSRDVNELVPNNS